MANETTEARTVRRVIRSVRASDGAGVKMRRSLGQTPDARVDPFLMLDEFGTDNPDDYIAGFPSHPPAASRPSRTCSRDTCGIGIIWATRATSRPEPCSG